MRTGRPRKSQAEKEFRGTAQKCRPDKEPANFVPLQYVPDVPKWIELDALAATEWKRLAPLLIADNALAEKDLNTLAHLCLVQSEIMRAFRGDVGVKANHATYIRYASALGLAHNWRQRVAKGEKEQAKNPFAELKQRPN